MMRIWILLMLVISAGNAAAEPFETGEDLFALCRQAADPAKRSDLAFGLCMGYIDGYISGYRFKKEVPNSPPICDDIEKRSRRQVLQAVVSYLESNLDAQKELKSIAMYRALLDRMTCKPTE